MFSPPVLLSSSISYTSWSTPYALSSSFIVDIILYSLPFSPSITPTSFSYSTPFSYWLPPTYLPLLFLHPLPPHQSVLLYLSAGFIIPLLLIFPNIPIPSLCVAASSYLTFIVLQFPPSAPLGIII